MKSYLLTLIVSLCLQALIIDAQTAIFGVDDRELIQSNSPSYSLSRSTAVAILTSLFQEVGPSWLSIHVDRLDSNWCPTEKFYN